MEQKSGKGLLILLTCLIVVSLLLSVGYGVAINKKVKSLEKPVVDFTPVNNELAILKSNDAALGAKMDALQASTAAADGEEEVVTPTDRANQAYNEILKEDDEEALAEQIATEYLSTKDFKKVLVEFLNADPNNEDGVKQLFNIESYRDVKDIVVKDIDVKLLKHSDDAEVTFELKVSYFNDGDDDEEDIVKAKVKVVLTVEELDEDEDYEDAEVVEGSEVFDLIKIYE